MSALVFSRAAIAWIAVSTETSCSGDTPPKAINIFFVVIYNDRSQIQIVHQKIHKMLKDFEHEIIVYDFTFRIIITKLTPRKKISTGDAMLTKSLFRVSALTIVTILVFLLGFHYTESHKINQDRDSSRYYVVNLNGPIMVHVLELDMDSGNYGLTAWRSGGLTHSTRQVADAESNGKRVLGAVNADFFSFQTTLPIGNQITDGEWVYGIRARRAHVLVDDQNRLVYGQASFEGEVRKPDGEVIPLTGVNRHRANDQAMFYNQHYSFQSRSDSSGVELHLRMVPGQRLLAGNVVRMVVERAGSGYSDPVNGNYLISVGERHTHYDGYSAVSRGDTLDIFLGFSDRSLKNISQAVGGGGHILRDGMDVSAESIDREGIAESFLTTRHPRTLIASNKDQSKVWLIVADGRQASSVGMNFVDMAKFLLDLGATDAVNLDGGGSTTMVYNGSVVNSPSDPTGERAVANIFLVEKVN